MPEEYEQKKLNAIKEASNDDEIITIIKGIYDDGYSDGEDGQIE